MHRHGIAIAVNKEMDKAIIGFWPISDKVVMVKLKGKPCSVTLIQACAPTEDHDGDEVEMFYEQLTESAVK